MDNIVKDTILREGREVEAEDILTGFREFLLVFYGAAWAPKSHQIANAISSVLLEQNPDDEN